MARSTDLGAVNKDPDAGMAEKESGWGNRLEHVDSYVKQCFATPRRQYTEQQFKTVQYLPLSPRNID